jgi:aspartyl-tRNA(Asn)/glutamyl-tRNA(Gln) amidotransferase subunit B
LRGLLGEASPAQLDQVQAVVDQGLDDLVVAASDAGAPAALALARAANEVAADLEAGRTLDVAAFATLVTLESEGALSATQSKEVLGELLARGGGDPEAIAKEKGFEAMSADSLAAVVAQVIDEYPDEWARLKEGDKKVRGFLTGAVMKSTKGQADGKAVAAEFDRLLA